tara:strand:- start:2922 stop:3050 length:129 start_codon:yes stop_codon:yes gene_type:complete
MRYKNVLKIKAMIALFLIVIGVNFNYIGFTNKKPDHMVNNNW